MRWTIVVLAVWCCSCEHEKIHENYQMRVRVKNGPSIPIATAVGQELSDNKVIECTDDDWHWWPARADGTCSRADKPAVDESALSIAIFNAERNCTPKSLETIIQEVKRIDRESK